MSEFPPPGVVPPPAPDSPFKPFTPEEWGYMIETLTLFDIFGIDDE